MRIFLLFMSGNYGREGTLCPLLCDLFLLAVFPFGEIGFGRRASQTIAANSGDVVHQVPLTSTQWEGSGQKMRLEGCHSPGRFSSLSSHPSARYSRCSRFFLRLEHREGARA